MLRSSIILTYVLVGSAVCAGLTPTVSAQTATWTHLTTSGPGARYDHGMAYDSFRGRVVLFGGRYGTNNPRGDTWEWDGTDWVECPVSWPNAPSARWGAAMAYDSARQVTVLYGGTSTGRDADTWEWDGQTWTDRGVGPGSRWGHAMAYDAQRGWVIMFGGQDNAGKLNDTWRWDGGSWIRLNIPDPVPSPRDLAAMTYDSDRQRIVLFGGQDATQLRDDTWELTWEYDGYNWNATWNEVTPGGAKPSARSAAAMTYDIARQRTILFGGSGGGLQHDTWAWDGTNWSQESSSGPSGRSGHRLVYNGKVFLFGGLTGSGENRETWDYGEDGGAWAACCFADGSCQDKAENHCLYGGGVSWRDGYPCSADPCASPPPEFTYFLGDQPLSGSAAHQVNTSTGNFHYDEQDFSIASRGHPLAFGRHYNSMDRGSDPDYYPLGPGWHHTYNIVLRTPTGNNPYVTITWADGQATFWEEDGSDWKPVTRDLHDTLAKDGAQWVVTRTNLDVYRFDSGGRLLSIADRNGNTVAITYDATHTRRISSVTDAVGRMLNFDYRPDGLLTSVSAQFVTPARIVLFNYTNDRLTQVTDVLGQHIDYTYDAHGYLATVKDQRQVTVVTNTYAPDGSGQVKKYRDGNGNETEFQYRSGETEIIRSVGTEDLHWVHKSEMLYQRQTIDRDPLGHEVKYTYDENFNRKSAADRNGNTTFYEYDAHGNVTKITEPDTSDPNDGGETTFEYGDSRFKHLPTKRTDALGYVTEWTYDDHGNRLSERRYLTAPPGSTYVEKTWTYNAWGQVETATDERGGVTTYTYDETTPGRQGLLLSVEDPEGNTTWYGHDDLWRRVWVVDGRGTGPEDDSYKTRFFYDAADRLIRTEGPPLPDAPGGITRWFGFDEVGNSKWVTNGKGSGPQDPDHTITYDYDNNRNRTATYEPLGRVTRFQYDELDRKVRMADANGNLNNQYTQYTYDHGSRLTERRDPENNPWTYTHDPHGNVLTATDPSGFTITYEYDALHRRTVKRDGLTPPNVWHTEYDKLGRVTRTIDPTAAATQFTYDGLGRLVTVLDAEGGTTQYTHDAGGNLLTIQDANGHVVSGRQYDGRNLLIRAEDGNGNYYTYGFDAVGNQTSVRDANDQPSGPQTLLTYDAANRRTGISYPDGTSVSYTYDNNGNRVGMTDPNGASSFGYDELNRLVTSVDSFGRRVDYAYDPVGNRTRLTYPGLHPGDPGKEVLYTFDKANRLTSITDWSNRTTQYTYNGVRIATVVFPNGVVQSHSYDVGGRLTDATSTLGGSTVVGFTWTRDGTGAPLTATETGTLPPVIPNRAVAYLYDHDNRLTESTRGTYQYDANGNLTARTLDGITTLFEYDDEDRLVTQVRNPGDPTPIATYHVYDGDGNRIARTDDAGTTQYVLDRGVPLSNVLCETDTGGNVIAYYIHGATLIARIDATDDSRYYHTTDLGNVVALTDAAGAVTDRYAYEPYGLPVSQEGSTPNCFTFVGGRGVMTEDFGDPQCIYFMRARFYDPDTGRFLGKDPAEGALTNPLGLNRYTYVPDNPLVSVDPSGLLTDEEWEQLAQESLLQTPPNSKLAEQLNRMKPAPDYLSSRPLYSETRAPDFSIPLPQAMDPFEEGAKDFYEESVNYAQGLSHWAEIPPHMHKIIFVYPTIVQNAKKAQKSRESAQGTRRDGAGSKTADSGSGGKDSSGSGSNTKTYGRMSQEAKVAELLNRMRQKRLDPIRSFLNQMRVSKGLPPMF